MKSIKIICFYNLFASIHMVFIMVFIVEFSFISKPPISTQSGIIEPK